MRETRDRVVAVAMIATMLFGSVAPACAQADGAGAPAQDPPSIVGRIARVSGTVSYHGDGATQWDQAQINYPVTSGSAVWTQPSSSADLDVGPNRVTLDQGTEFDVETLNDQQFTAVAPHGRVYLRVRDLPQGQVLTLRTPRGTVTLSQPGRYEIVAGDTRSPTQVTVQEGQAQVAAPGVSLVVGPRQTARIAGDDEFVGRVVPQASDGFLAAQVERDQPTPYARRYEAPPEVQQMTGYDAVAETGEWVAAPDYGRVWYPPVERGWVPYRHGHWAFVQPWGWTWVDDAPWGFAPFHYGRWVEIDDRWAWTPVVPGAVRFGRPVYAPALVAFIGLGVGAGVGASVGWIPLGPREAYRPPYRASNTYIRNVNISHVTNSVTNAAVTNPRYVNSRATTMVPATALTRSQPVAALARPVSASAVSLGQPLAQAPVQPTRATLGVTPRVAQSLNLPVTPGAGPAASPRPGPPIRSAAAPSARAIPSVTGLPQPAQLGRSPQPMPQRPSGFMPQPGPSGGSATPVFGRPYTPAAALPAVQPVLPRPAPPTVQPFQPHFAPPQAQRFQPRPTPPPAQQFQPHSAPPLAQHIQSRPAPPPVQQARAQPAPPPPPPKPAEHKVCPPDRPRC